MKQIAVRNLRLCTKDCLCLYVCPVGATDTEDSIIDVEKCIGCGVCADACPSGAISMVPEEYPPQQKKEERVLAASRTLSRNKAKEEAIAHQLAQEAGGDGGYRLMKAAEKSIRLVHEDLLRESGYMLPQSENTHTLLKTFLAEPIAEDFPAEAVKELQRRIPCNENKTEDGTIGEEKMSKYTGTQTEKNLEAAFAGESQARNKYTYFASVARKKAMSRSQHCS